MARQVAGLIAAALLAAASLASAADPDRLKTPQIPWSSLAPEERQVLEPVAKEWPAMPGYQQQRLQGAARKYPSMRPIQKERFDTRIRDWAAMTPDQRKAARETFQGLRKLPPAKPHELTHGLSHGIDRRWLERHGRDGARPSRPEGERRSSPPPPPGR